MEKIYLSFLLIVCWLCAAGTNTARAQQNIIAGDTSIIIFEKGQAPLDFRFDKASVQDDKLYFYLNGDTAKTITIRNIDSLVFQYVEVPEPQPFYPGAVSTLGATFIDTASAVLGGNVVDTGNPCYIERGVVYGLTANPTITEGTKVAIYGSGTGEYGMIVESLTPNTTYNFRAYLDYDSVQIYGQEETFTTLNIHPALITLEVTGSFYHYAVVGGNITVSGMPKYITKGVLVDTIAMPAFDVSSTINVVSTNTDETGAYIDTAKDLTAGKTYYALAYAITVQDTVYGEVVSFQTLPSFLNTYLYFKKVDESDVKVLIADVERVEYGADAVTIVEKSGSTIAINYDDVVYFKIKDNWETLE
jgi:hypothetical protein